jgi:hypothetical protein
MFLEISPNLHISKLPKKKVSAWDNFLLIKHIKMSREIRLNYWGSFGPPKFQGKNLGKSTIF